MVSWPPNFALEYLEEGGGVAPTLFGWVLAGTPPSPPLRELDDKSVRKKNWAICNLEKNHT